MKVGHPPELLTSGLRQHLQRDPPRTAKRLLQRIPWTSGSSDPNLYPCEVQAYGGPDSCAFPQLRVQKNPGPSGRTRGLSPVLTLEAQAGWSVQSYGKAKFGGQSTHFQSTCLYDLLASPPSPTPYSLAACSWLKSAPNPGNLGKGTLDITAHSPLAWYSAAGFLLSLPAPRPQPQLAAGCPDLQLVGSWYSSVSSAAPALSFYRQGNLSLGRRLLFHNKLMAKLRVKPRSGAGSTLLPPQSYI